MRGRKRPRRQGGWFGHWLGALAFVVPLLMACGGAGGAISTAATAATPTSAGGGASTAATTTTTLAAPAVVTSAAAATTATAGGTVRAIPLPGHGLSGQDRVGAPGLGAFLFFDAAG